MNQPDQPPAEAVLQAWVDDRLTDEERRRVSSYLEANPEVAARLCSYRQQGAALRAGLRSRFPDDVPARFRIEALATMVGRRSHTPLAHAAALVTALGLGAIVGGSGVALWMQRAGPPSPVLAAGATLAGDAFLAHRTYTAEERHFVEVAASEPHLLRWLSNRLGRRLVAPDLERVGYRLIGGRLLPTGTGPAAQLMYEDAAGARLTVYLRADPQNAETAFRFDEREGVNGFWWSERGFGYALYGPIDRDRLLIAAQLIYDQTRS